jgi:hypothetical protein
VLGEVQSLTERRIQELRDQLSERGRKAGLVGGRKAVESGQLATARSLPQAKEAQRINGSVFGRINGRKNVESGQLARLRTPEHQVKAACAAGRKAVESGQLARLRTPEHQAKAGRTEGAARGRLMAQHNRWHINRVISKPDTCALCAAALRSSQESVSEIQGNQTCPI